jgi:hypothetical protein
LPFFRKILFSSSTHFEVAVSNSYLPTWTYPPDLSCSALDSGDLDFWPVQAATTTKIKDPNWGFIFITPFWVASGTEPRWWDALNNAPRNSLPFLESIHNKRLGSVLAMVEIPRRKSQNKTGSPPLDSGQAVFGLI